MPTLRIRRRPPPRSRPVTSGLPLKPPQAQLGAERLAAPGGQKPSRRIDVPAQWSLDSFSAVIHRKRTVAIRHGKEDLVDGGLAAILAGAIGVAGTALGGLAAIYGTKIGAEANAAALAQQVRRQTEAERSQWVRGQRAAAYQQFLAAWDEYTLTRGAFHSELPPNYANWRAVQRVSGRFATAAFQVRMVGPESVTVVADEALVSVMKMQLSGESEGEFRDAYQRFRGNPSPELQNRMMEIAEEALYNGSWDSAIDIEPLRRRFLDAVYETLGSL